MAKKIRVKLQEQGVTVAEALDYTRLYGRSVAMRKYGIKTYDRYANFLEEETHDPNFGIAPINRPRIDLRPTDIKLLQKREERDSNLRNLALAKAKGRKLDAEIADLEAQFLKELEDLFVRNGYGPSVLKI
jgi:hypothetical protein